MTARPATGSLTCLFPTLWLPGAPELAWSNGVPCPCTSAWGGVVVGAPAVPRPWAGCFPLASAESHGGEPPAPLALVLSGGQSSAEVGGLQDPGGAVMGAEPLMVIRGPQSLGDRVPQGWCPLLSAITGWGSNEPRSRGTQTLGQHRGSQKGRGAQNCPPPPHHQASPSSPWAAHPGTGPLLLPGSCLSQPPPPPLPWALLSLIYHPSRRGALTPMLICRAASNLTRQQGSSLKISRTPARLAQWTERQPGRGFHLVKGTPPPTSLQA